uniref:Clan AA aspartic protease, AF_0612 family n=1 Tax=Candidatus Kentrum sp. SD TaxID=2126332 RepID=A0A451BL96_9GAMM|nr:MAG: clan AA aspartic protease, AF_0612 family [Candidatus Kentron sp. SD]VFK44569.1 MAG: clan AA aspartic protease, AF_0612 family [Candidatus Kentron sp. SD]VFK79031.1 MAG: clan AA aspartic protease, AF_0612 family [Candidatus Kentron sp. SD]
MGMTHVTTQIFDFHKTGKPYEAEFLVDTGAMDCMADCIVSAEELERIGIRKEQKSMYELASGERVEYELGFARIAVMGQETVSPVIFGPKGIEPILGVLVLESLGFIVDPTDKQLKKLPARPLK